MARVIPCVIIAVLATLHTCKGWWVTNHHVSVKGYITCAGEKMRYTYVKLMDDDPLFDDTLASGWTDGNGYFSLSGKGRDGASGKPDIFVRVYYNYRNKVKVANWLGKSRTGSSSQKKDFSGTYNFGTLNFNSEHCKASIQFSKAVDHYFKYSGNSALPYSYLRVRSASILTAGTPWAMLYTVRLPKGYSLSEETAKHEFAHTIRHSLDGSLAHFLVDVIKYKYAKHHSCNSVTNPGFAFNEGWAEYWSGGCPYNTGSNVSVEGDVARMLRKLAACKGHAKMWNVLEANRGRIHSYNEFRSRLYAMYGSC